MEAIKYLTFIVPLSMVLKSIWELEVWKDRPLKTWWVKY